MSFTPPSASTASFQSLHETLAFYDPLITFISGLMAHRGKSSYSLLDLDIQRHITIPALVASRQKSGEHGGAGWLTKEDMETLVDWKLKRGTYRSSLRALVASNSASLIETTTAEAFALFAASVDAYPSKPLTKLIALRGVGPATASLLLSTAFPDRAPFFGDELCRWILWDDSAKGGGWERVIKYTTKEYKAIWEGCQSLRERLKKTDMTYSEGGELGSVALEKCAFVCGKYGIMEIRGKGVNWDKLGPGLGNLNIWKVTGRADQATENSDSTRTAQKARGKDLEKKVDAPLTTTVPATDIPEMKVEPNRSTSTKRKRDKKTFTEDATESKPTIEVKSEAEDQAEAAEGEQKAETKIKKPKSRPEKKKTETQTSSSESKGATKKEIKKSDSDDAKMPLRRSSRNVKTNK